MCAEILLSDERIAVLAMTDIDLDRFAEKFVFDSNGCWTWIGGQGHWGHGRAYIGGDKFVQAHRVTYHLVVGDIPEGSFLDHLCRNPSCINPAHLEPVTPRTNTLRASTSRPALNAAKTHCIYGHPLWGENLMLNIRGHRVCRICNRRIQSAHHARQKAVV